MVKKKQKAFKVMEEIEKEKEKNKSSKVQQLFLFSMVV